MAKEMSITLPNEAVINGMLRFVRGLDGVDVDVLQASIEIKMLHREVEVAVEKYMGNWGLSYRQIEILEALFFAHDGIATPGELSKDVGLTRSAMTSALDSLEEPGYLTRGPHPSDRRRVAVSLTKWGRQFLEERLPDRYRELSNLLGTISPEERKTMVATYSKLLGLFTSRAEERS